MGFLSFSTVWYLQGIRTLVSHSTSTYSVEIAAHFRSKLTQGKSSALALYCLGKTAQAFHVEL